MTLIISYPIQDALGKHLEGIIFNRLADHHELRFDNPKDTDAIIALRVLWDRPEVKIQCVRR